MNHFSIADSVESIIGPYSITLALNDTSGVVSGNTPMNTVSGVATFTGLRLLTMNYFILTASYTDMISADSSAFYVENYVYSVVLSVGASPSLNFDFVLTVTLKGEDNALFKETCTVTLTESSSSLQGTTLSKDITGGTGTFDVYLSSLGTKTVVATCPNTGTSTPKIGQIDINVLANTLFLTSTTPLAVIFYLGFKQYHKLFFDC